jgi:DNA gyrase subunit B
VKKGKNERYLRDELYLDDFLIDIGIDSVQVGTINGEELKKWVKNFLHYEKLLDIVERKGRDRHLVSTFLNQPNFSPDALRDRPALEALIPMRESLLKSSMPELAPLSFMIEDDTEIDGYRLVVTAKSNGSGIRTILDSDFLLSPEIQEIARLGAELRSIGSSPFVFSEKGEQKILNSQREVVDAILARSRKGEIQRERIGEMNQSSRGKQP